MDFSEILIEYLQLNSMSVSEFARLIEVKPSQVSEWKRGKAKPGYDTMKQILKKTNKPADFWFDLSD